MTAAALAAVFALGAEALAQQAIPVTLRAQYFRYDPATKILVAEGDVVVIYQDATIRAQRLVANLETGLVRGTGQVSVETGGQTIAGEAIEYNLYTRVATLLNASADLTSPQWVGPIFLRAERVEGIPDEFLTIRGGQVTTCEGPTPDYQLTAGEITLYVGDKIVFRDVTLWIAGRKLYTVPYFVIFLREGRPNRPLPTFGYNAYEGFYVKAVANYFLDEGDYGFIYLDLMSRLGSGIGIEHVYTRGLAQGSVYAYALRNFRTQGFDTRARLIHSQPLWGGQVRFYVDRVVNQGRLISPLKTLFASADGSWAGPGWSTLAYAQHSGFEGTYWGGNESLRLLHSRRLGPTLTLDLALDAFEVRRQGVPADREVLPRVTLRYTHPRALVTATLETRLDPDANPSDARYVLERLPDVTVALAPVSLGRGLVLTTQVSAGRLRETVPRFLAPPLVATATRVDGTATLSGGLPLGPRTSLFAYVFGRAAIYSGGERLGVAAGRLDLTHQFTDALSGRTGYTFRFSRGTSPFVFDRPYGTSSVVDASLAYRRGGLVVTASSYYDLLNRVPGDLQLQAQYVRGSDLSVAVAATYSFQYRQLSRVETLLDWKVNERWRLQYEGTLLPPTRTLYVSQVRVVYTKQCWAAALTFRPALREVWLEAWITAFPYARGTVGAGPQGPLFQQPYFQSPGQPAAQGGGTCAGGSS